MLNAKLWHKVRPQWSRPFVEEPDVKIELSPASLGTPWATLYLVVLSTIGFASQVVTALQLPPLEITLTILWVTAIFLLATTSPRTVPYPILVLYLAVFVAEVALLTQNWHHESLQTYAAMACAVLAGMAIAVCINMPMRHPAQSPQGISAPYTIPENTYRSPEDNLTLWQWATVSWMTPLMSICTKRQLEEVDVWQLPYTFQHQQLFEAFQKTKGSVLWRVLASNVNDLVILSLLGMIEMFTRYGTPLLLQQLLLAMQTLEISKQPAVIYTLLILLLQLIETQCGLFSIWYGRRAYERSRGEMIAMIFEKALRRQVVGDAQVKDDRSKDPNLLVAPDTEATDEQGTIEDAETQPLLSVSAPAHRPSPFTFMRAQGSALWISVRGIIHTLFPWLFEEKDKELPAGLGKILNHMKSDVYEVSQRLWDFQEIVTKPIGAVISFVIVYRLLGWSCLVGLAFSLIMQFIVVVVAQFCLVPATKESRAATDKKLNLTTQYTSQLISLRWSGWQTKWVDNILIARRHELQRIIVTRIFAEVIHICTVIGMFGLPLVCFWAYTSLAGNELRIDVAFPALELLQFLQDDLKDIPDLIESWLTANVALGRIELYMGEPDIKDDEKRGFHFGDSLELRKASFAWPGLKEPVLKNVSLTFPVGLTVIYGKTPSGKSALLRALLNEMDLLSGELVKPKRSIAYCAQAPWLQSMTIRDNILFGSPLDEARYDAVLEACALKPDFANFPGGDHHAIGTNGRSLSGGQIARTALARALYSRADILLLDDPLSALDQQTAELVVKCLHGSLVKGRTIILVTHRVDLCKDITDQFVEIDDGRVRILSDADHVKAPSKPVTDEAIRKDQEIADKAAADLTGVRKTYEDEEKRQVGRTPFSYLWTYVKAGGLFFWILVMLMAVCYRGVRVLETWLLKEWTEAYGRDTSILSQPGLITQQLVDLQMWTTNTSQTPVSRLFDRLPNPKDNVVPWLLLYAVTLGGFALFQSIQEAAMTIIMYFSGRAMFKGAIDGITSATFRYLYRLPDGLLMNRMTSDIAQMDNKVSRQVHITGYFAIACLITVILIASVTWYFFIVSFILSVMFVLVFNYYIPASQNLRRLESVFMSPLMSNLLALGDGLMTIRAFATQEQFQAKNIKGIDMYQKMDHFYWSAQGWLNIRYGALSSLSTAVLTLLAIGANLSVGLTAFVLVSSNKFVQCVHYACRTYGELQMSMVAVERVVEIMRIEPEKEGHVVPPAHWPTQDDDIEFENVTLRYDASLEPALKNMSFHIKGGSSVAIIGRTGSGKSTVTMALLGTLIPDSGRITIGGIDVATVDKQALRTRITYLPQKPTLLVGKLRLNIDPLDEHSDEECSAVIQRIGGDFGWTLDTPIEAEGKNLSEGQKQLVSLARAILRRSAIIIMDEATASIDKTTAWEMQRMVREEIKGSTVLTIAHRPSAVRGADYCLKLAAGEVVAQGKPEEVMPEKGPDNDVEDVI